MEKLLQEMEQELQILKDNKLKTYTTTIREFVNKYLKLYSDGVSISYGELDTFYYLLEKLILQLGDIQEIINITRELTINGITSYEIGE